MQIDLSKSLQELENQEWGDAQDPTHLMRRCHELRRVPLNALSAEDCRLLLGQEIGVPFLVPLALRFLSKNPLEGGKMRSGVLLRYVLELKAQFWEKYPDLWWEVREILVAVEELREGIDNLASATREFEALETSIASLNSLD